MTTTSIKFNASAVPSLAIGLGSGITAYATDFHVSGTLGTLWLRLGDGRLLRVQSDMHQIDDRNELGSLVFEPGVEDADLPELHPLPEGWMQVRVMEKLVYRAEDLEVECGLSLQSAQGEWLTVLPGEEVYTLALDASFWTEAFLPENDLDRYHRLPL